MNVKQFGGLKLGPGRGQGSVNSIYPKGGRAVRGSPVKGSSGKEPKRDSSLRYRGTESLRTGQAKKHDLLTPLRRPSFGRAGWLAK